MIPCLIILPSFKFTPLSPWWGLRWVYNHIGTNIEIMKSNKLYFDTPLKSIVIIKIMHISCTFNHTNDVLSHIKLRDQTSPAKLTNETGQNKTRRYQNWRVAKSLVSFGNSISNANEKTSLSKFYRGFSLLAILSFFFSSSRLCSSIISCE